MGGRGGVEASKATRRFVHAECSLSGRKTTLLDLGDELLLNILNHLQEANVGAVNKRLNQLHFSVRGICATISSGSIPLSPTQKDYTEEHLCDLLRALAHKGAGSLQQLSVKIDQDKATRSYRQPQPAKLDWLKLISSSLQKLELKFYFILGNPRMDLFTNLASCTNLETLELTCGRHVDVCGEMLAQVLAGCKKLKKLHIIEAFSYPGDSLELASESLEELSLILPTGGMMNLPDVEEVSLSLETPALTILSSRLKLGKLDLRSHALRTISMECLREVIVASPLANLVFQECGPGLDTRVAEASWVKVEDIVVMALRNHFSESDQYDHLYNSVVVLERVFPSVQRIVLLNCLHLDAQPFGWCYNGESEALSRGGSETRVSQQSHA